ncbi:hypothetical protein Pst134EA_026006 [Puccinia striiformis f. sp. tritici]|uniref:hypothetical protein n=1 Tax=Puccinia striiformis f. sp. tritici TaxID=168172 RepID=UPI002008A380|nr:hypothetical protein Pst134EA_025981 [Puccinia striiformis f. sp. tritici]XP_047800361.1 hypothetical protein Pst134EA_026006 [Puccinia striiformis f. sp. tritici]KAH9444202.1 hypothetical protein Pst134EB_026581 [Puccinia striiformis f. sp. tritici]KAH9452045.1 hypothetical protein Pst134EA_025981 [Puccinia striiformis f. sp. tritici]KAH9452070.1 hypothetical protein Pst134EA_026006 [Puccinia striiformis f. sp. tritici]
MIRRGRNQCVCIGLCHSSKLTEAFLLKNDEDGFEVWEEFGCTAGNTQLEFD